MTSLVGSEVSVAKSLVEFLTLFLLENYLFNETLGIYGQKEEHNKLLICPKVF